MASSSAAQEIVLSSNQPEITQKKIILKNITSELLQKNGLDGVKKLFRIYDDRILSVTEKSKTETKSYVIALSLLDTKPRRKSEIDIKYTITAIVLAIVAYLVHYLKGSGIEMLSVIQPTYFKIALAVLASGSVFCFIKMMRSSLVFKTANGKLNVVEMYMNKPNKAQCQKFMVELVEKITAVKKCILMPSDQKFAVEISEHRRLRDEGIITEEQYEFAKQNIFENQAVRNKTLKQVDNPPNVATVAK